MQDFFLDDADRAFRAEVRTFLQRELAPRAADIEDRQDWGAVKHVVRALGEAGYLRLMFQDLYRGSLVKPGLTHATIVSEEAAYINYAFETTIATALSCAYPLHRHASERLRETYLAPILDGKADVVFECVGRPGLIAQAVDQVRNRGTILLLGLCTMPDTFNSFAMLSKEVRLVTSAFFTRGEYEAALDALSCGAVEPRMLVTGTIALDDTPARFEALRRRTHDCKVLIAP